MIFYTQRRADVPYTLKSKGYVKVRRVWVDGNWQGYNKHTQQWEEIRNLDSWYDTGPYDDPAKVMLYGALTFTALIAGGIIAWHLALKDC